MVGPLHWKKLLFQCKMKEQLYRNAGLLFEKQHMLCCILFKQLVMQDGLLFGLSHFNDSKE